MNLLTTGEVAERLRLKPATIRSLVRSGNLSAIKIGTEYRFDESDLSSFIDHNRTGKKDEHEG